MNPFRRKLKIKFVAAFVLMFLCLNAGASACLAYCEFSADSMTAMSEEHCPLAKLAAENCPKNGEKVENEALNSGEQTMYCCAIPINFVFAPLEKNRTVFSAVIAEKFSPATPKAEILLQNGINTAFSYHSPPLDRRISRIKYGVFLI